MSLLSKIGKFVGRIAKNPITQVAANLVPGGGIASRVLGGLTQTTRAAATLAVPAAIGGVGFEVGSALASRATRPQLPALPGAGFTTGGSLATYQGSSMGPQGPCGIPGYHYAKDGSGRLVKNRRMNYLNPRAANRAVRRVKGAMKMLKKIEKQLPTRTVYRRK